MDAVRRTQLENVRRGKRRQGVSLVEVMIAMVILSFGLLGVAALQVRAITEGSSGSHMSNAGAIARNRLEELNRLAWDAAVLNASGGNWADATVPTVTVQGVDYSVEERIAWDDPDATLVQLKAIEVRASWSDEKRANRQVVLTSARLREVGE